MGAENEMQGEVLTGPAAELSQASNELNKLNSEIAYLDDKIKTKRVELAGHEGAYVEANDKLSEMKARMRSLISVLPPDDPKLAEIRELHPDLFDSENK